MALFQPVTQVRMTNVAVIKYKSHGKRFEVACYKNKILNWRNGIEKDLDEVLQIPQVFENVSKGKYANRNDLLKVFGTADDIAVCKVILDKGEIQVSEKEREVHLESLFRDVATVLAEMCVNAQTGHPLPVSMLESALRDAHFSVRPNDPAKKQALRAFEILQQRLPNYIARAHMRLRVVCAESDRLLMRSHLLQRFNARIESEDPTPPPGETLLPVGEQQLDSEDEGADAEGRGVSRPAGATAGPQPKKKAAGGGQGGGKGKGGRRGRNKCGGLDTDDGGDGDVSALDRLMREEQLMAAEEEEEVFKGHQGTEGKKAKKREKEARRRKAREKAEEEEAALRTQGREEETGGVEEKENKEEQEQDDRTKEEHVAEKEEQWEDLGAENQTRTKSENAPSLSQHPPSASTTSTYFAVFTCLPSHYRPIDLLVHNGLSPASASVAALHVLSSSVAAVSQPQQQQQQATREEKEKERQAAEQEETRKVSPPQTTRRIPRDPNDPSDYTGPIPDISTLIGDSGSHPFAGTARSGEPRIHVAVPKKSDRSRVQSGETEGVRARTASVSSAGQGSDQKCEVAGTSATPAGPKETSKAPVSEGTGAERGKGGGRPVKCSACLIACDGPAHYRTHVRSEWHLLNVKRKVREMRPLSEDEFSKMSEKDVTAFLAVES
uniref:SBDS family rRNA metabolism protein n=1 Tax=Chromera velia CCMP2878 TaxID=1169474 RepID=A0A0G4HPN0_9ALVE|eukprot:Cvel_29887.t1-p1 / transcript=Cvel_29887.t1 / gene=Cvel_29887 / organism=Chromera_velia_CCMP2878 / gene_product=Ribosome maturation protein SBDS, putative / transcript_product=Ribosome maturation protein SBDS, putative / location=Cvel_scaffold4172:6795-9016(+) / protein_length=666 / sequence_SO=supercontig / SO=protein_coding / is_pseudo=false